MPPATTPVTVVTATLAGNIRTNQDHAVVTPRAVAVLDGAMSWLPQDPARDGGWYARTLGAALTVRLEDDSWDLAEIVGDAIEELRDRYALVPGDSPTSTVTIVRGDSDAVEIYTPGDSPAVVFGPAVDPVLVYYSRLEPVGDEHRRRYRAYLAAGHGYDGELSEMIANCRIATLRPPGMP
jgi:hypothetical protein